MLAAVLASSQLAVYGLVILRNLNYRKKIEKVHLKYFHTFILLLRKAFQKKLRNFGHMSNLCLPTYLVP